MSEVVEQAPAEATKGPMSPGQKLSDQFPGLKDIQSQLESVETEADAQVSLDEINSAVSEVEVDVPASDFWDNNEEQAVAEPELQAEASPESQDVSVEDDSQTITYKANGQELKVTLDEAKKKLAMAEGGAQAFTKLAQANKRLKELESRVPELEKQAELINKLEEIKHDPQALLQLITGQDYNAFLDEQVRRREILKTGTESEKAALEKADRLAALERKLAVQAERQQQLEEAEQSRAYSSEKEQLKSMLNAEYFKHQFKLDSEVDSNDLNEMLWQQGQQQMQRYVKKYQDHPKFDELLPKMAEKSFQDVAGKLKRLTAGQVQAKVDEAIAKKKQKAAEQVQVASARQVSGVSAEDFKGMGVREIADKLLGKKTFSF